MKSMLSPPELHPKQKYELLAGYTLSDAVFSSWKTQEAKFRFRVMPSRARIVRISGLWIIPKPQCTGPKFRDQVHLRIIFPSCLPSLFLD